MRILQEENCSYRKRPPYWCKENGCVYLDEDKNDEGAFCINKTVSKVQTASQFLIEFLAWIDSSNLMSCKESIF